MQVVAARQKKYMLCCHTVTVANTVNGKRNYLNKSGIHLNQQKGVVYFFPINPTFLSQTFLSSQINCTKAAQAEQIEFHSLERFFNQVLMFFTQPDNDSPEKKREWIGKKTYLFPLH